MITCLTAGGYSHGLFHPLIRKPLPTTPCESFISMPQLRMIHGNYTINFGFSWSLVRHLPTPQWHFPNVIQMSKKALCEEIPTRKKMHTLIHHTILQGRLCEIKLSSSFVVVICRLRIRRLCVIHACGLKAKVIRSS